MGRLFLIGALLLGAYMYLNDSGSIRLSSSGGGSGKGGAGFSTYAGASGKITGAVTGN